TITWATRSPGSRWPRWSPAPSAIFWSTTGGCAGQEGRRALQTQGPDSVPARSAVRQEPERLADRQNLLQLVQLRWLAVGGQLATILVVRFALDVPLPLSEMLALLLLLALFNV